MRRMLAIALIVAAGRAAVAACPAIANVRGEQAIATAIEAELSRRGVHPVSETGLSESCRSVRAEVHRGGGRIVVWIEDSEGHRSQRSAEDIEAAATAIEAWARVDLTDPLLATRRVIAPRSAATHAEVRPSPSEPLPVPSFAVLVGGDAGVSGDGASWAGLRAQGCGRIGRICIGGAIRYATDLRRSGDTALLGTARTALAVALTGELPIRRGSFAIAPGLGVGMTSVTATLATERELEQASAVHARAHVAVAYRVFGAWSVRADLVGELAPTARTRLGEDTPADRQLAASPIVHAWLGLTFAYGGP